MMQQGMPPHMAPQVFQHPGSMTPVTFARWQHDMVNGVYGGNLEGNEFPNARRHNPLYDTPPVSRRTNQSHLLGNLLAVLVAIARKCHYFHYFFEFSLI